KHQGVDIKGINYDDRKALLKAFITQLADNRDSKNRIALVNTYTCPKSLQSLIFNHKGEGIITKRKKRAYQTGKRHHEWFKIKNMSTFSGVLTSNHILNDYFIVAFL